jgi:nicotinamide mononucleotide transporter PnuC
MFKDWNIFEKLFLLLGTLTACILTFVFKGTWIDLGYTLLYFWTALLLAKGKYACYIIGIISVFFYAYISYTNSYFGEVIIALCCTLPLMIVGLINWLKHQDNTNTVIIKEITKKEIIIVLLSQVLMSFGYYYLLKTFNTNNLLVSTFSIVASIIATYLTARRSEYGFIGFIINDMILITLWSIPVIQGNTSIIPVVICPILLFINDIYGVINWKKIKNGQMKNTNI